MSPVAYEVDLSTNSKVHRVFHVSKLKQLKGNLLAMVVLPKVVVANHVAAIPTVVLKNDVPHVELLILWEGVSPEETLWEPLEEMATVFPFLDLVDKVSSNRCGDDTFSLQHEMLVRDLQKLEEAMEVKDVAAGRGGKEEGSDRRMVGALENNKTT